MYGRVLGSNGPYLTAASIRLRSSDLRSLCGPSLKTAEILGIDEGTDARCPGPDARRRVRAV